MLTYLRRLGDEWEFSRSIEIKNHSDKFLMFPWKSQWKGSKFGGAGLGVLTGFERWVAQTSVGSE